MSISLACTGHRPQKLGGFSREVNSKLISCAEYCFRMIAPELVIVGGALGWDQACASAAHNMNIPFDVYFPFQGYDARWPQESKEEADRIHSFARNISYVCSPGYAAWKMQRRNEAMVDSATHLLALHNGSEGGTMNCVLYARGKGMRIYQCWDRFMSGRF